MLVMYVTGLNRSSAADYLNYINLFMLAFFIYQWVTEVKLYNEGFIEFSKIFKGGLLMGTVGGIVSSIFFFVQVKFIDTGYMDFIMNKAMMEMQKKGMSDEMIDQSMKMASKWTTPEMLLMMGIVGSLFISSFVAVIMAFIMKKPNPNEIA